MATAGHKTLRFTKVVERAGQPHVHTLWVPPDKDPDFKRALDAHRVMTIEPSPSGHAEVGLVGFDREHHDGQFLVFPKSLKRFEGARVVGIKFDLVAQPKLAPATRTTDGGPARPPATRGAKRHADATPRRHAAATKKPAGEKAHSVPAEDARAQAQPPRAAKESATPAPASRASAHRKTRSRPGPRATEPDSADATAAHRTLVREVRAALKDLQAGKAVAAYQRLEHALENE